MTFPKYMRPMLATAFAFGLAFTWTASGWRRAWPGYWRGTRRSRSTICRASIALIP